jgi:hypothetical protein
MVGTSSCLSIVRVRNVENLEVVSTAIGTSAYPGKTVFMRVTSTPASFGSDVCESAPSSSAVECGAVSQMPSHSHNARSSGGVIFRLGQNTKSKLLRGILVSLECLAVDLMSSVTIRMRSRFSSGSRKMRDLNALTRLGDGGLLVEKLGSASVDSDGGFRIIVSPFRGPVEKDGPLLPLPRRELFWLRSMLVSEMIAASNCGRRSRVKMGSGTEKGNPMTQI